MKEFVQWKSWFTESAALTQWSESPILSKNYEAFLTCNSLQIQFKYTKAFVQIQSNLVIRYFQSSQNCSLTPIGYQFSSRFSIGSPKHVVFGWKYLMPNAESRKNPVAQSIKVLKWNPPYFWTQFWTSCHSDILVSSGVTVVVKFSKL